MSATDADNYDEEGSEKYNQVNSDEPKKKKRKKRYKLCNWIRGAFLFCFCGFWSSEDEKKDDDYPSMTLVETINAVELEKTQNYEAEKIVISKKLSKAAGDHNTKFMGLSMMPAEKTQSFEDIPGAVIDEKELVVSRVEGEIRLRRPKTAPVNRKEPEKKEIKYFPPVAFWTPVDIKQSDLYKIDRNLPNLKLHMQTCIETRRNKTRFLKPLKVTPTGRKYGLEDSMRKMRPKTAPTTRTYNTAIPSIAFWTSFDVKRSDVNEINRNLPSLQNYASARPKSRRSKRRRKKKKSFSNDDFKIRADVRQVMDRMMDEICQYDDIRDILESPIDRSMTTT
ncbi:uncharacterized protein LOC120333472 [Styela clava]